MRIKIPPEYSVAQVMGDLKGKSSLMIFESFSYLRHKFGNRHFWCTGCFVSTVGVNNSTARVDTKPSGQIKPPLEGAVLT